MDFHKCSCGYVINVPKNYTIKPFLEDADDFIEMLCPCCLSLMILGANSMFNAEMFLYEFEIEKLMYN